MKALTYHGTEDVRVDEVPERAPEACSMSQEKEDGAIKVVLKPGAGG